MRTENCGLPDSSSRMMQNKLDEEYQTGEYNEYNFTTDGQWQSIKNLKDKEICSVLIFSSDGIIIFFSINSVKLIHYCQG